MVHVMELPMIAPRVWLLPVTVICLATPARPRRRRARRRQDPVVRMASVGARRRSTAWCSTKPGSPIDGVVISALGGATAFAVTDRAGQYQLPQLPPGPYVVRAHRDGFAQVRSTLVNVRSAVPRAVVVHAAPR